MRGEQEHQGQEEEAGDLEHAEQPPAAHDADGQPGQDHAPHEAADLLPDLDRAHDLLLIGLGEAQLTSARPGTMRGTCWIAPKAAP